MGGLTRRQYHRCCGSSRFAGPASTAGPPQRPPERTGAMTDTVGKFPKKGEGIVPGASPRADADAAADSGPAAAESGGLLGYLFTPSVDKDDMAIWLEVKRPYLIHPETTFNSIWDIMSMFLIIYSCITIPYRLCFNVAASGWVVGFDKFVDSVFMFDCALTFRKCYWGEDGLVADPGQIASSYMKGWFFLDFFSSFPFDSVLAATGNSDSPDQARILKVIRIFRMVKILRMVRIKRLLKKLQDDMGIKNGIMISVKFTLFTCFAAHFQACLWFYMSDSDPADNWALGYGIKADAVNYDESNGDAVCGVVQCTERVDVLGVEERLLACPELYSEFGAELEWNTTDTVSDVATCVGAAGADDCWILAETALEITTEEYYQARRWFPEGTAYPTGGVEYLYKGAQDSGIRATCPATCEYKPPLRTACIDECNTCDTGYQYMTSFYWSIVTLTTLGYGDIGPSNHFERMFGVYAMLLGASIFAYSVTNMCTLVHNLNPAEVYNRTRLDELNDYLGFLSAPEDLAKRCQDFFLYKIRKSDVVVYNQDLILQDMSKTMQEDVRLQALNELLAAVPLFADQDIPFLRAVAVRMDTDPLSPGQVIAKKGDILTKMHIIGRGIVELRESDDAEPTQIGEQGIYGVGALFRPSKSAYTATTLDYIDLYALSKYHFDEVLQLCDMERKVFEDVAIEAGLIAPPGPVKPAPESDLLSGKSIPVDRLKQQIQTQANFIKLLTQSGASD